MANTHMAIIQSLDNSVELIAEGPEDFVRTHLAAWVEKHPPSLYDRPRILQIIDPAPEG